MGAFLNSIASSLQQFWSSVTERPEAATVGGIIGAILVTLFAALKTAFPVELPAILAIVLLVMVDHRSGIRAAHFRGEEVISRVSRVRLGNKLAAYGELYLVALAAKTLSPTTTLTVAGIEVTIGAGLLIYGGLMGVICGIEIWSILENKYTVGDITVNPNEVGVLQTAKRLLLGSKDGSK